MPVYACTYDYALYPTFPLQQDCQIIYDRGCKNHTVKTVQYPSVPWNQFPIILNIMVPLNGRRCQVAHL